MFNRASEELQRTVYSIAKSPLSQSNLAENQVLRGYLST